MSSNIDNLAQEWDGQSQQEKCQRAGVPYTGTHSFAGLPMDKLLDYIVLAVCDPRAAAHGNVPSHAKAVETIIDRMQKAEQQRKASLAAERQDCEKALRALAGWYPTPAETYGTNSSWAISDLCRAVKGLRDRLVEISEQTTDFLPSQIRQLATDAINLQPAMQAGPVSVPEITGALAILRSDEFGLQADLESQVRLLQERLLDERLRIDRIQHILRDDMPAQLKVSAAELVLATPER